MGCEKMAAVQSLTTARSYSRLVVFIGLSGVTLTPMMSVITSSEKQKPNYDGLHKVVTNTVVLYQQTKCTENSSLASKYNVLDKP